VLAQVALTRILCRRYIRGNISNDEWEFRKREPMHTAGPMNLRPLLDRDWYDKGGAANVSVSIGFFFYTLPFMPLGLASRLAVGSRLPSFRALLSPERFLLRCNLIKDQAARVTKHPLFFDIATARLLGRVERIKGVAMKWREGLEKPVTVGKHNIPVAEQGFYGPVVGHGGSSFGNVSRRPFHMKGSCPKLTLTSSMLSYLEIIHNLRRIIALSKATASIYNLPAHIFTADQVNST
jgi:hypothetical protein